MGRYIIVLVELGLRSLILVVSIFSTIYIIVLYNYTFMQYALVHIQMNGTGYAYESNDVMLFIMLYVTVLRHLPIIILHVYMYISPMLYKHELYNIVYKGFFFILIVYVLNKVCFSIVLPILVVIITDIQFNIGQDVLLDISVYISLVKWIRFISSVYVFSLYRLYTNRYNVVFSISIYRRLYMLVLSILFVIADDVSVEGAFFIALLVTLMTELFIFIYAIYININY